MSRSPVPPVPATGPVTAPVPPPDGEGSSAERGLRVCVTSLGRGGGGRDSGPCSASGTRPRIHPPSLPARESPRCLLHNRERRRGRRRLKRAAGTPLWGGSHEGDAGAPRGEHSTTLRGWRDASRRVNSRDSRGGLPAASSRPSTWPGLSCPSVPPTPSRVPGRSIPPGRLHHAAASPLAPGHGRRAVTHQLCSP